MTVVTKDLFGFVHRAGTEQSSAKVLAELSKLIGDRLMAYRVTMYVIDGERVIPLVSEYSSGATNTEKFAEWRGAWSMQSGDVVDSLRAGEDLVLISEPEAVISLDLIEAFNVQPFLAVALRTESALLGVLVVEGDLDDLVAQQDEILTLAGVVALVLETAGTFERERERTRETEALLEVGAVLTESTDVTEVLAAVARNSARVCGFERCSILILDDVGRLGPVMSQFADGHVDMELWDSFRSLRTEFPAATKVIASRAPAVYREPETVPDLIPAEWLEPFDIQSVLLVPLVAWEEGFGVLMLDHRERHSIGPEQVRIALAVAAQGAAAIGISRLLEREGASRRKAEATLLHLRAREVQQAGVAEISQLALTSPDLTVLMDRAVGVTAKGLNVEYAKVLELLPDGEEFLLRAGVGWNDGLVGIARVPSGPESQAGFTLLASGPVIVEDLATDDRFHGPALLTDHGVTSGLSVVIGGHDKPYGVLGAHTTREQTFRFEDVIFLQSMANVLSSAIEQARGEQALFESEERLQAILDTASDAIVSVDANRRIILFNQHACRTFGYSPEEVLGQPLTMLLPVRVHDVHDGYLQSFAIEESAQRLLSERPDLKGRRKNGEEFPVEITISRARLGDETILTAIIRDITERRAAEERLQELLRSKDELIHSVSHEIRTPLTSILGFAELLKTERAKLSEAEKSELLQTLLNESTDVANIVEDLIVAAKADIGKLQVMHVSVNLRAQAAQVLEAWDQSAAGRRIDLSGEDVRCVGDPARVRQVVRNLVSNAIRYGGDNTRVEVGVRQSTGFIILADDGAGVPDDDVELIFENYQRGATAPGLTRALGLGLGISRHLARAMGGDITYRHSNGESIFEFTLPLEHTDDDAAEDLPSPE